MPSVSRAQKQPWGAARTQHFRDEFVHLPCAFWVIFSKLWKLVFEPFVRRAPWIWKYPINIWNFRVWVLGFESVALWSQDTLPHLWRRETQLVRCHLRYSWAWDWKALAGFSDFEHETAFFYFFFPPQLDFTVETGCKNPETREQTAFYGDLNYILHLKNQPEQRVQWPGAVSLCQPPAALSLATAGHTPKAPGAPWGRPGEGAKWKESI